MHKTYSILDRCGNNWLNGKGGCGILSVKEVSQTVTTAFNPWLLEVRQCDGRSVRRRPRGVLGGKEGVL